MIKTNILVLVIRLQDIFKTSCQDVFRTFWRRLQDVFKTSSRNFQDVFKTSSGHLQDVFKTFWRRLQDVWKTYHQVKLFLLTRFQDVFEIYSKRFWDILQRRLSRSRFFWEIYGQCTKFARVSKVSQILVSHFKTPFSGYLQRRIYNVANITMELFLYKYLTILSF